MTKSYYIIIVPYYMLCIKVTVLGVNSLYALISLYDVLNSLCYV